MSTRVRVLPTLAERRPSTLAFGLGLLNGLAWTIVADSAAFSGVLVARYGYLIGMILGLTPLMLIPLIVGYVLVRIEQRPGRLLMAGLAIGLGTALGRIAGGIWNYPDYAARAFLPSPESGGRLSVFRPLTTGLLCLSGVGLFGLLLGAEKLLGRRVLIQNGSICNACGYDIGVAGAVKCPECGVAHAVLWRSSRLDRLGFRSMRQGRWFLAAGLAVSLCLAGYVITTHTIPCIVFARSARAPYQKRSIWVIHGDLATWKGPSPVGWYLPDADDPSRGIAVQINPWATSSNPQMYVCRVVGTPLGFASNGSKGVVAELNNQQAQQVLRDGAVPQGLIAAVKEQAKQSGWVAKNPFGVWKEDIIDPKPYFPAPPPSPPGFRNP